MMLEKMHGWETAIRLTIITISMYMEEMVEWKQLSTTVCLLSN